MDENFEVCLDSLVGNGCRKLHSATGTAGPDPASSALADDDCGLCRWSYVPVKYSCTPGDASVSPELKWSQVPAGTQSFALVLSDLDNHPGEAMVDFPHWIVWNIPATATSLAEGVPSGATLADGSHQTGFRGASYLGPCAPVGPNHHYMYALYALDTMLTVPVDSKRPDVMKAAEGHVLGAATWISVFHK